MRRHSYTPHSSATYKLPAPYGQLPQMLDPKRMEDADHVREAAMEIIVRAGKRDGAHLHIELNTWRGLLREQCFLAQSLNPFVQHNSFDKQWDFVLLGLIDRHYVDLDIATGMVTVSELDAWLFECRNAPALGA